MVRLERTRLEPGVVATALAVWSEVVAHPGSSSPHDVYRAREILQVTLGGLPAKSAREFRTRIAGLRPGSQLPNLGACEPPHVMTAVRLLAPLPAKGLFLNWELGHAGWADCRIGDETSELSLHFGYCTDALHDLLAETASVIAGRASTARFLFDAEPAEYRWTLRSRADGVDVCIRLRRNFNEEPEDGVLVWRSCQPRIRLASVFADAAQRVLDAHGVDGYLRRWVAHPFPADELRELYRLANGGGQRPRP